jgi:hypothetical protein
MRRAFASLGSLLLVIVVGCRDYDVRLDETLQEMKYRKRLDDNLGPAPTKSILQQELIFVRPPKGITGPAQTFALPVEAGKFDLESTFIDQAKAASLHIVARHKKPKAPTTKKTTTPAPEATPRGDFTADVLDLIKNAYAADVATGQLKNESKTHKGRTNAFKFTKIELGAAKEVQLFLYGGKNDPYEVALIFEYPTAELNNISPKIGLCLECFAVGPLAGRAFSGATDLEIGEEGEGGVAPPI